MGCDYYAEIYVGVPVKDHLKTVTRTEQVQELIKGTPVFDGSGKPITKTRSVTITIFQGKEYRGGFYDIPGFNLWEDDGTAYFKKHGEREMGLQGDEYNPIIGARVLGCGEEAPKEIELDDIIKAKSRVKDWLVSIGIGENPRVFLNMRVSC